MSKTPLFPLRASASPREFFPPYRSLSPTRLFVISQAVICVLAQASSLSAAEPSAKRPNILFLLTDDQRGDALGAAGNPLMITPEMDRLARDGTFFRNSFCTSAVCAVSRASILSGQYSRTTGIRGFAEAFTDEQFKATYPMILRRAGYYTGFIGKWGVGATINSLQDRLAPEFDYWKAVEEQGEYWPEGKNGRHLTKIMTSQVEEFLNNAPKDKPFCLSVSYKAPHGPWSGVEPECFELYKDTKIPMPKTLTEEAVAKLPDFIRTDRLSINGKSVKEMQAIYDVWTRQYYGLITGVDRSLGQIRSMLKEKGLEDNTIIIFTSDNGHFLFEYGLSGKWLMYEASFRVPLIIYDPRIPSAERAKSVDAFALSIDMAPTILNLADMTPPETMQGRSLVPLLHGQVPSDWRKDTFHEYFFGMFPGDIPFSIGVRDGRWKYIRYLDPRFEYEQLFDLQTDPDESNNLAKNPEVSAELIRLRARLEDYRSKIPDNAPEPVEYRDKYQMAATGFTPPSMDKPLDLEKEKTIGQSFKAEGDLLHAISWMLPYQMKKIASSDLLVDLRRGGPEGEVLASTTVPRNHLYSLYPCMATFDVPVKRGETLYVEMRPKDPIHPREIQFWAYPTNVYADGQAFLDGKPTDSDLALSFIYQKP